MKTINARVVLIHYHSKRDFLVPFSVTLIYIMQLIQSIGKHSDESVMGKRYRVLIG